MPFDGTKRTSRLMRRVGGRDRLRRPRRSQLTRLPSRSLAPNVLTTLALCSGLTSIRFSLQGHFNFAVIAICVAAIFDGLDGRVARLLKGTSQFGAELDSLSDFLSFGVAPVIALYLWSLEDFSGLGWIAVLTYAVCCALRLARFNVTQIDPDRPVWAAQFFTGVPAPASALIALVPLMASFATEAPLFRSPYFVAPVVFGTAVLMVSRVPTFSFKRIRVPRDYVLPILVAIGVAFAVAMTYPWEALVLCVTAYAVSLPFSFVSYRQHDRRNGVLRAKGEFS